MFDGYQLRTYLAEVGELLKADGIRGDMFVVGGAAMALAYNTRRSTRDIDAIFEPKQVVYTAARKVAARHEEDLDEDWLNDAVKGFLLGEDLNATVAFEHPGLTVRVASPRYLLTMKVLAARIERDADDVESLYQLSKFASADEAIEYITTTYPALRLLPKSQFLLEEIAAKAL